MAGNDRTIHHGIARARDIIFAASQAGLRCEIGDQDCVAAFDYLVLPWVWKVLQQKGVADATILQLEKLFSNGITVLVVNSSEECDV